MDYIRFYVTNSFEFLILPLRSIQRYFKSLSFVSLNKTLRIITSTTMESHSHSGDFKELVDNIKCLRNVSQRNVL